MSKIIGIDLGTTNSCVSVLEGNEPVVIANSEGRRTTPSIVAFMDNGNGERKVGDSAKRQAITNPQHTVHSIKRFMGEKFSNMTVEIGRVPYEVVKGDNDTPRVKIGDRNYTPQEISAIVLQKMKKTAEDYLGQEVTRAVITVPAYFNDAQRQATKEAGEIAGLVVERIINEPTAAALAYGLDKVIIDFLADEFKNQENIDLRKDPMALQRLKEAAEKTKIELSASTETDINLPYITAVDGVPKHLVMKMSRSKFEQLAASLIQRTLEPCKQALKDANMNPSDIDEVILVGGSTRIPAIQKLVEDFFGKAPSKGVNPDEAVAVGAAVQGGVLTGEVKDVVLLDVTPLSMGIETMGGVMTRMIESNTTIPTKKTETFSTAMDNQPSVEIHILQGERPMANDNKTIGRFILDSIPPSPRGVPQIEVTFDIDANGILSVHAKDKATGKEQKIRIEASSGLSKEDIEKMKKDAEMNAESDAKRKDEADKVNAADALVFSTEKQITEYGDKIPAEKKSTIESALGELKKAIGEKDFAAMETASAALNAAWQAASQDMYNATGGNPEGGDPGAGAGNGAGNGATGDQVQDVDFEEVK